VQPSLIGDFVYGTRNSSVSEVEFIAEAEIHGGMFLFPHSNTVQFQCDYELCDLDTSCGMVLATTHSRFYFPFSPDQLFQNIVDSKSADGSRRQKRHIKFAEPTPVPLTSAGENDQLASEEYEGNSTSQQSSAIDEMLTSAATETHSAITDYSYETNYSYSHTTASTPVKQPQTTKVPALVHSNLHPSNPSTNPPTTTLQTPVTTSAAFTSVPRDIDTATTALHTTTIMATTPSSTTSTTVGSTSATEPTPIKHEKLLSTFVVVRVLTEVEEVTPIIAASAAPLSAAVTPRESEMEEKITMTQSSEVSREESTTTTPQSPRTSSTNPTTARSECPPTTSDDTTSSTHHQSSENTRLYGIELHLLYKASHYPTSGYYAVEL